MRLFEGRFAYFGAAPEGILGKVGKHFSRVLGGAREISEPEKALARAIVCSVIEDLGGKEEKGLWSVDIHTPQDLGSRMDGAFKELSEAAGFLNSELVKLENLRALPEKMETLEALRLPDVLRKMEALVERLEKLETSITAPNPDGIEERLVTLEKAVRNWQQNSRRAS